MITDKFKRTIFDKLTDDLSHVELIFYNDSLWFINREKKYWYLDLEKSGKLYWRWQFFTNFFSPFTMERNEYEPLIKEWVESALNCGVTTTVNKDSIAGWTVESALNCGVTTTQIGTIKKLKWVESALNCGVTTTLLMKFHQKLLVESALNCGVTTTVPSKLSVAIKVESVLNGL